MAKRDSAFHDYVLNDLLGNTAHITSRPMFGGYGFYNQGLFFALIAGGELYFKVDNVTIEKYTKMGSHPFTYSKKNKGEVSLGYWALPEEIMEDRDKLEDWVEEATEVAKRAKKK